MILGVDPGTTSGWCLYDPAARRVVAAGMFPESGYSSDARFLRALQDAETIAIERPVAHGPTRPQVVECAWIAGLLFGRLYEYGPKEITRLEIKRALTAATLGEVQVRNDATAWAACLLLHGGSNAAGKGGPLHGLRSHSRAALAVCLASSCKSLDTLSRPG
jgi:hypothetical protein